MYYHYVILLHLLKKGCTLIKDKEAKVKMQYKNSYKAKDKELVSLSVYNVGYQKCDCGHQWGPGIRDHFLIHYIVSGKGYYEAANKCYHLKAGDLFLIYPDTQVIYYADQEEPWEYYWVGFSGSDAGLMIEATDLSKEHPYISSFPYGEEIKNGLYQIYEVRGNEFADAVAMTGQLYKTLSLLIAHTHKKKDAKHPDLSYVQKGISYMESNFSYPITIEDVANYVGISRSHLFREFKAVLNKSPKEYLVEYRIRYACYLLKNTNLTIASIALSVGYENGLYFSKAFKSVKHMTPTQFKELN